MTHVTTSAEVAWPEEYAAAQARVAALVREAATAAGPDGLDAVGDVAVPACPAWTVRHLLAHLTGLAVAIGSGDLPGADQQAWLDGLVETRLDRSVDALLDEWSAAVPAIERFLERMGPNGGQMVYDVVAHEHDLRGALGRPGARDSSGVLACATAASASLARDLAAHGLPAVRITSNGRTWDVGVGEPELAIELDPFELIRVLGSRRSEAQMRRLPWAGDLDRYLPGLAHMPFPAADLVE